MANSFEIILDADAFIGDATSPPVLEVVQDRPVWAFDDTTEEIVRSKAIVCPAEFTGGDVKADIHFIMATATSGFIVWNVQLEAVTENDALDLDSAEGFDAENTIIKVIPAVAGRLAVATIDVTNKDSMTTNDYFRIKVSRKAADTFDTASGDSRLLAVRVREEL